MAARPARSILFREMVVGTNTKRHAPCLRSRRYAIEGLAKGRHSRSFPHITAAVPEPPIGTPAATLGAGG